MDRLVATLGLLSLGLAQACAGQERVDRTPPAESPAEVPPAPVGTLPPATTPPAWTEPSTTAETGAPIVQEMYGFSFVDEIAAGMPQPSVDDLPFLASQELSLLVTLTETPMDPEALAAWDIEALHLPIPDMEAPSLAQQDALVAAVQARASRGEKVGIHCFAGLGRTGTMLATWFVSQGAAPQDAIDEIRRLRPGSIETGPQEDAVHAWAVHAGLP